MMRYKIEITELLPPIEREGNYPISKDEKIYEQKIAFIDLPALIIFINNQQKDPDERAT